VRSSEFFASGMEAEWPRPLAGSVHDSPAPAPARFLSLGRGDALLMKRLALRRNQTNQLINTNHGWSPDLSPSQSDLQSCGVARSFSDAGV
jgi:hypothetical protein